MGRPKKEKKKEIQLSVKVTPEFKAALEAIVQSEDLDMSKLVRRALRKEHPNLPE